MIKILFLAANPLDTDMLRIDEEMRAIDAALRQGEYRDQFDIRSHLAVRVGDLQELLLRHQPDIVHFSGHGSDANEIILQNEDGNAVFVDPEELSNLFGLLRDNIRCVVLNACYSGAQAAAIADYIDWVVGMSDRISDGAALEFAASFYRALGYGRSIQKAHALGCSQIDLSGLDEQDIPQLTTKRIDLEEAFIVAIPEGDDGEPAQGKGKEPYQGLNFFDVEDADRFFGRETLTAELVDYLREHHLLAIIGASGSGKSSVVRAGVVPRIQANESWLIAPIITPTAHPIETLATALVPRGARLTVVTNLMDDLRSDARCLHLHARQILADDEAHDHLLLVVDQFEELFTLCRDKTEQTAFVDNLLTAAAPDGMTTVVLTLRADFYAQCADFANLRTALENDQRYIGAMTEEELRAAIERPAEAGNWTIEPGLVDRMLDDVTDEPGALPLLSHALLETWKRRSARELTFGGYHAAGGVVGGIAHTADSVYDQFDADEQAIARNIFLRLTELGEGVEDTRRRVPLQELMSIASSASMVEEVLQKLQDQRLVTTVHGESLEADRDDGAETDAEEPVIFVDVTHEALIREWPALHDWLAENREGLRIHRELTEDVEAWEKLNRDQGALYRGLRLQQTAAWAQEYAHDLNEVERAFLAESQKQVEEMKREQERIEQEREEARQRELEQAQAIAKEAEARGDAEITSRNRTRWALGAAVIALILAGAVSWFLLQQNLELRGARLFREAQNARDARDVEAAVKKFEAAAAADPTLGIDVANEINETFRHTAIQLVHEGEELAAQDDRAGAAEKFKAALALNPPPDTPVYLWIPEGDFLMGSGDDDLADDDEQPRHRVFLDDYWILSTEVTNELYKRCVEADACEIPENKRWDKDEYAREPVTDVTWRQASAYAAWVGGELPTEAQWERACRGADGAIYPWGDDSPDLTRINYWDSGLDRVVPVGRYPSRTHGLYDMSGNVREWTSSLYDNPYPYDADDGRENPKASGDRTLRGGSWKDWDEVVRCADREFDNPGFWDFRTGFRVVSRP